MQTNATGDTSDLGLIQFAGEVLAAYEEMNVMWPRHRTRTIAGGLKAAQFPVVGKASTAYHSPGENLLTDSGLLNTMRQGARLIAIDKLLTANVFVDNLDEILNHFDLRSEYARQLGYALANRQDQQLMQVLMKTSQIAADALFTGSPGGYSFVDADAGTNAVSLVNSIYAAKQAMDEKDVPAMDRYVALTPALMKLILTTSDAQTLINADFNPKSNGGYAVGKVYTIAGMEVVESNHLPGGSQYTTAWGQDVDNKFSTVTNNDYSDTAGEFEKHVAFCWQKEAIGSVRAVGLSVDQEFKIEYQGTLLVAKVAQGHGPLRPECTVAILSAALV